MMRCEAIRGNSLRSREKRDARQACASDIGDPSFRPRRVCHRDEALTVGCRGVHSWNERGFIAGHLTWPLARAPPRAVVRMSPRRACLSIHRILLRSRWYTGLAVCLAASVTRCTILLPARRYAMRGSSAWNVSIRPAFCRTAAMFASTRMKRHAPLGANLSVSHPLETRLLCWRDAPCNHPSSAADE